MKKILLVVVLTTALFGVVNSTGASAPERTTATVGGFGEHWVKVFFGRESSTDCSTVRGYYRRTMGVDVLHDALNQVLRGPRASEASNGAWSFFSNRTAGLSNDVRISSGVAYIDFDDFRHIIPNATSSCGSTALLSQLDKTAKQFPRVQSVRYSFEGNRIAFYEWLQMSPP